MKPEEIAESKMFVVQDCPSCKGMGRIYKFDYYGPCPECKGKGTIQKEVDFDDIVEAVRERMRDDLSVFSDGN